MINRPITGISISDVHLGHHQTTASYILKNLNAFIDEHLVDKHLDLFFIAGDLFDHLLDYPNPVIAEFTIFAHKLLKICAEEGTKLRILEGTPSHDRHQSSWFRTHASLIEQNVDCKYVDALSVEKIPDLGISLLYIPDEWNADTEVTYQQALDAVHEAGLNQVDLAIMHGQFNYQLPPAATKIPRHNEAKYLELVKHFIFIGHVHVFSVYERILAQGSFDRIAHGEENPKGGIYFRIQEDNNDSFLFLENKNAKTYITINLRHKDAEASIQQIEKRLKNLPEDSRIRLRAKKDHPLLIGMEAVRRRFPRYTFTKVNIEDETKKLIQSQRQNKKFHYTPITITADNLEELVIEEVKSHHQVSEATLALMRQKLREVR